VTDDTGFCFLMGWLGGLTFAALIEGNPAFPILLGLCVFFLLVKLRSAEPSEK
jgi:hypothetical protein